MNTTMKSLVAAALLSSAAAVSFAQAPSAGPNHDTALTSVTKKAHHRKHHQHHGAHRKTDGEVSPAGK